MNLTRKSAGWMAGIVVFSATMGITLSGCKTRLPNVVSKSQEIDMGKQLASATERQYRVITSGPDAERLARVSAKLIPLAKADYDVPFSVKLLDSNEINAFAAPGGPVYFYKGLVDLAASDDELAAVVGHELSHVTKRHSARQLSDAYLKQLGAGIALGASRAGQGAAQVTGLVLGLDQLNYSRSDEDQADEQGMKYMVAAGYDPNAMASFFKKMEAKAGGGGGPEFLRSHPLTSRRIEKAQERAKQYQQ